MQRSAEIFQNTYRVTYRKRASLFCCRLIWLPHSTASRQSALNLLHVDKAVNREDKQSRRYRNRDFAKFERSRRYRDRYRC